MRSGRKLHFGAATGICICSPHRNDQSLSEWVWSSAAYPSSSSVQALTESRESQAVRARHKPFSSPVSPTSLGTGYFSGTQSTGAGQSLNLDSLNEDKCFPAMRQMMQFGPVIGAASQQLGRFDGYLPHAAGVGSSCGSSPTHCLPGSIAS